jgi:hypothetical protein
MYESSQAFLAWAASYDEGGLDIRSRQLHEEWLGTLPCPILCFEGEYTIEEQLAMLMVERRQEPARRLLSCDALTPSPGQLRTEQGENSTFILRS